MSKRERIEFEDPLVPGWWEGKKAEYEASLPFRHVVVSPLGRSVLTAAREELTTMKTQFKETDLFRLNQTIEFANLAEASCPPAIWAIREALNGREFKAQIESITGCTLSEQIDMAGNVYSRGCNLRCHDDCISTRAVSYILYLSDEPWDVGMDGGALELYAQENFIPQKCIPPTFGTICLFHVKAGESLHSVQEVFSVSVRRISIQGWFHTNEPIQNRENATLASLTCMAPSVSTPLIGNEEAILNNDDATLLASWINPQYLTKSAIDALAAQSSCVLLQDFLLPSRYGPLARLMEACDGMNDFEGQWQCPDYSDGVGGGWQITGPPFKQRFCILDPNHPSDCSSKLGALSSMLQELRSMFISKAFATWMRQVTGSDSSHVGEAAVRRFRPGLDYTVADHSQHGAVVSTWCSVIDSPLWEAGDVGGHEIFSPYEDASTARSAAEVYDSNNEDVLSISPRANCFSIVAVPNLLEFVQYVSAGAPSSRFDVSLKWVN